MKKIWAITLIAFLTAPNASFAKDFSLYGILDYARQINYDYLYTLTRSELRKLWDKEVGNFLLCTGQHPVQGAEAWGIYTEEQLKKYVCDEEWKVARLKQLGEFLNDIFEDKNLTRNQKSAKVAAEIEEDIIDSPITSEPLGFGVGYSLRYSVARIHFNNMISFRSCGGVETQTSIWYNSATGKHELNVDVNTIRDLVYTEPSFKVYRVVDGVDQLVASVIGIQRATRHNLVQFQVNNSNGFIMKWAATIDGMYKFTKGGPKAAKFKDGEIVIYDFDADLRPASSTLEYRIDLHMRGGHKCPKAANFAAQVDMDRDGDGRIDFVPDSVYDEFLEGLDIESP